MRTAKAFTTSIQGIASQREASYQKTFAPLNCD
jgi:hypothetical protein